MKKCERPIHTYVRVWASNNRYSDGWGDFIHSIQGLVECPLDEVADKIEEFRLGHLSYKINDIEIEFRRGNGPIYIVSTEAEMWNWHVEVDGEEIEVEEDERLSYAYGARVVLDPKEDPEAKILYKIPSGFKGWIEIINLP